MMLLKGLFVFYLCTNFSYGSTNMYDTYTGQVLSAKQLYNYTDEQVENCTAVIKICDPNEGRRVNGSCNNLNYPARGIYFQPLYRLLGANYYNGYFERKSKSGKNLTLARKVRTTLLKASKGSHLLFNHNVPGFGAFSFIDVGSTHDATYNLFEHTICCQEEHMNDYECTPNIVPIDDPVHRFSGIRCMNSTRPLTYQDYGCTEDPVPAPIAKTTPTFDLSPIYNQYNKGDTVIRAYSGGLLITEEEDGKQWPPNGYSSGCRGNQGNETRCFKNHLNGLLPLSLNIVLFLNHHNHIARKLAAVNPCWDDNKLFDVARDINIGYYQKLVLDWLEVLEGRENLLKAGILAEHEGFRDIYDENLFPMVSVEYTYGMRWFHLMQESTAKLYSLEDDFIGDYSVLNVTFRPGLLAKDNNLEKFLKSTFMGSCHGGPHTVDYEMAERGFTVVQFAMDAPAGDLNKGRNLGVARYIDYVRYCTGKNITSFEDLSEYISQENMIQLKENYEYVEDVDYLAGLWVENYADWLNIMCRALLCSRQTNQHAACDPHRMPFLNLTNIIQLKENYEDVEDIDLMAGMWLEKYIEGGHIPNTLACIINEFMLRSIKSDRHWSERKSRPNAFTLAQLMEIRKSSLASLFCAVGSGVSKIPRNAFYIISPENPLVSCSEIPSIDFSLWADEKCSSENDDSE